MNNLSDIGFVADTNEQFVQIYEMTVSEGISIKCDKGTYIRYSDTSGVELYWQLNTKNEVIGMNPHYKGKSKRKVCLTNTVDRKDSELDGAFYAWANPKLANHPESGEYLFVFDLPDFQTFGAIDLPKVFDLQLTAFATEEFKIFKNEKELINSPANNLKIGIRSFVASGLLSVDFIEPENPMSFGLFSGIIKECELKCNVKTNNKFYWMLIDTLGGDVDVVADIKLLPIAPQKGNIVYGQFWLSGQLINPPV